MRIKFNLFATLVALFVLSLVGMVQMAHADDYTRRLYLVQKSDPFFREVITFSATTHTNNTLRDDYEFRTYDKITLVGVLPATSTGTLSVVYNEGYITNLVCTLTTAVGTVTHTINTPWIFRATAGDTVRFIGFTNGVAILQGEKRGGLSK
jgi:hypothetical protein